MSGAGGFIGGDLQVLVGIKQGGGSAWSTCDTSAYENRQKEKEREREREREREKNWNIKMKKRRRW